MKNKLILGVICALLLTLTTAFGIHKTAQQMSSSRVSVAVMAAQSGATTASVLAEGVVVPHTLAHVSVMPDFEGRVNSVLVDVGTSVAQGQVLAELDPEQKQDELIQAQEAVQSAAANLALVRRPHRPEELQQKELELESDKEAISEAVSHLEILQQGSRPQEIQQAADTADSARAKADQTSDEYQRNKTLFEKELISRADLEQSETDLTVARNAQAQAAAALSLVKAGPRSQEIQMAQAALTRARLSYLQDQKADQILKDGSRPEALIQAAADLEQKRSQAHYQALLFQHRFVRAPITGFIIARNINPGEVATSTVSRTSSDTELSNNGRSMFIIAGSAQIEFLANVDQRFFQSVHPGQIVDVSVEAYPGQSFTGKIVRVNPLINTQDSAKTNSSVAQAAPLTFPVSVLLTNNAKLLVPGQIGLMRLSRSDPGLVIPQSAVTSFTLGSGLVYVVSQGVVHTRSIRYDGSSGGDIRVTSGLRAGENVVVSDVSALKDNQPVQTVSASGTDQ